MTVPRAQVMARSSKQARLMGECVRLYVCAIGVAAELGAGPARGQRARAPAPPPSCPRPPRLSSAASPCGCPRLHACKSFRRVVKVTALVRVDIAGKASSWSEAVTCVSHACRSLHDTTLHVPRLSLFAASCRQKQLTFCFSLELSPCLCYIFDEVLEPQLFERPEDMVWVNHAFAFPCCDFV